MASKKAAGPPSDQRGKPRAISLAGKQGDSEPNKNSAEAQAISPAERRRAIQRRAEKRARLEAAQRRAKNRTRQTERGDWRQAAKVRKRTPVSIEVMSRAAMFAHPSGLVFHRAVKTRGIFDCTVCKSKFQPAEAGGYGFARRVPIWDDDLWLITICQQCFAQSDLVEKVRAYVCRENERHDPGEYEVVDVRLVGAKS